MKLRWLDRSLMTGPYITLCTSDAEFRAALKRLRVPDDGRPWLRDEALACAHHLLSAKGSHACVVCIGLDHDLTLPEVVGALAHESVHVWQAWRDTIGEYQPGREQEAYAVQQLTEAFVGEYLKRTAG